MMLALTTTVSGYTMQGLRMGSMRVSRAAMSKLVSPHMGITTEEKGEFGTTEFTMDFKEVRPAAAAAAATTSEQPQKHASNT